MRDLLKTIAEAVPPGAAGSCAQAKSGEAEPLEITNISMAGSVTLIGVGLQATFSNGRLSNLIDHGKKILPGEPGRSFFTIGNRREALKTDSAFSFDRKGQTGLRSILSRKLDREEQQVQIILDYYFADESSCLTLDIAALYPALPFAVVTESSPLELCLCSFSEDDRLKIEVRAPGRPPYHRTVTAGSRVFVLAGKVFSLRHGSCNVELEAAPQQKTRSEQLEFRVEKQRSGYLLWANLGGSYLPQSAVNLAARRLALSYDIRFSGKGSRGKQ
jgi:hypothetical protein